MNTHLTTIDYAVWFLLYAALIYLGYFAWSNALRNRKKSKRNP